MEKKEKKKRRKKEKKEKKEKKKKEKKTHKITTHESEYGSDNFSNWLLIPSRPDDLFFSSFDMYLSSSEAERYGMRNGSCQLDFCLQKSWTGFEHSYTVVRGSVNDSNADRKCLLKTFAVRFLITSADVERCSFVNTSKARHTDAILLSRSISSFGSILFWYFSQYFLLYFLIFFHVFRETFSLSLSLSWKR